MHYVYVNDYVIHKREWKGLSWANIISTVTQKYRDLYDHFHQR